MLQGNIAFFKYVGNIFNIVKTAVLENHDLQQSFKKCFPDSEEADGVTFLYYDCVNRYMLVGNNQYRKSLVQQFRTITELYRILPSEGFLESSRM